MRPGAFSEGLEGAFDWALVVEKLASPEPSGLLAVDSYPDCMP
jgi:hypothetical protein